VRRYTSNSGRNNSLSADNSRGASSSKDAARMVKTIAPLDTTTIKKLQLSPQEARRIFIVYDAKSNFSSTGGHYKLYRIESIDIGNGDTVGVPVRAYDLEELLYSDKPDALESTDLTVAPIVNSIMDDLEVNEVKFTEIKDKFMSMTKVEKSAAYDILKKISGDAKTPTELLVNHKNIRLWWSQSGKRGPIIIHRKSGPA
jgi:hypothetical protein